TSGHRRSCRSVLVTRAGRRSIKTCRRSNDFGDRWTRVPPRASSRVAASNTKGPKRSVIVLDLYQASSNLRNPDGLPVTADRSPRQSNGKRSGAMTRDGKVPTGLSIWNAVHQELTLNLYPLPFTTLPPSIFYIYLHPDDFDRIEGIVPRLVSELQQALGDE